MHRNYLFMSGYPIYESKWLGAVMEAHGLLLAAAESAPTD